MQAITYRNWNWNPRTHTHTIFYVASKPGDDGKDWGYHTDPSKAIPLSPYWQRRFAADCRRVNATPHFHAVTA